MGSKNYEEFVTEQLRKLADRSDSHNRYQAAIVFRRIKDARSVPLLLEMLSKDEDALVRSDAALALGNNGGSDAVPNLCAALNDPVDCVKGDAASALLQIGELSATVPLCDALAKEYSSNGNTFAARKMLKAIAGLLEKCVTPDDLRSYEREVGRCRGNLMKAQSIEMSASLVQLEDIVRTKRWKCTPFLQLVNASEVPLYIMHSYRNARQRRVEKKARSIQS